MTTHNDKSIDKLVAEVRLSHGEEPIALFWDRNKHRYVAKKALGRDTADFHNIPRFDFVGNINDSTELETIRQMIEKVKRKNCWDQPIPTSMQNLTVDWE